MSIDMVIENSELMLLGITHWKTLYVLKNSKGVPKDNVLLYQL